MVISSGKYLTSYIGYKEEYGILSRPMLHFNTFMERNIYFQKILRYIKNITTRRILYYREDKISVQIYIFYERK